MINYKNVDNLYPRLEKCIESNDFSSFEGSTDFLVRKLYELYNGIERAHDFIEVLKDEVKDRDFEIQDLKQNLLR